MIWIALRQAAALSADGKVGRKNVNDVILSHIYILHSPLGPSDLTRIICLLNIQWIYQTTSDLSSYQIALLSSSGQAAWECNKIIFWGDPGKSRLVKIFFYQIVSSRWLQLCLFRLTGCLLAVREKKWSCWMWSMSRGRHSSKFLTPSQVLVMFLRPRLPVISGSSMEGFGPTGISKAVCSASSSTF